ncbi:site-2 protease family protein [Saccharothrix algeriensis]|uniref:Zinc metalloprotease n=1 Tax=Saccharothrix algeriensis TaxID=173560 RepID=A0A8T8HYV1_9PSEU|nr:site-2 protease family protein [Saccharothrix algeriensis]MBM7809496.1 Zn-dependent protease [Saccharothrix algeriensis]QTR03823.1 site-2 protease family protein [Saccharothrix algeriensis]
MVTKESWRRQVGRDGGLPLFRAAGIPVLLAPSWWLGSAAIVVLYAPLVERIAPGAGGLTGVLLAATFAIFLGLSVLAHELGHSLVALRLGLPVRRLRLFLLGGVSEVMRTPTRPAHEGLIAAAGPVVSIVLAGAFALAAVAIPHPDAVWLLIAQTAFANAAVAVFNLLPGLPLDGGRILRAGVWAATGRRSTGTRAAVVGGVVVAVLLVVWAVWGVLEGSEDRWVRFGVCLLTAWFVVAGARGESAAERKRAWPAGLTLGELVRPVLQLPAESPVSGALTASAGRGVVLVRADGVAAGLLDRDLARRLAATSPHAPAEQAAVPIRPETVLLENETGDEVVERVHGTAAWEYLVVDLEGRPAGVLRREDLKAALHRR